MRRPEAEASPKYLKSFERDRDPNPLFCNTLNFVFLSYLASKGGLTVEGSENLPTGPALLVPNHVSHLDHGLVGSAVLNSVGRHVNFVAKSEFWEGGFGWFMGRFVELGGGKPIDRNLKLEEQPKLINSIRESVENDGLVVVYAEGKRVDQTEPITSKSIKSGPIKLSKMLDGIPIVPVGLAGVAERNHMSAVFGERIDSEKFEFDVADLGSNDIGPQLEDARALLAGEMQSVRTQAEALRETNLPK